MTTLPATRQSRPPGYRANPQGGLAVIPRHGFEGAFAGGLYSGPLAHREALLNFAAGFPSRLSEILGAAHPTFAKAQSNWVTAVATAPGSVTLLAYADAQTGEDRPDDAATAEVLGWLRSLPGCAGGLEGLRTKGALNVLHYGLTGLEAVPGPRGTGVASVGFVDPLSLGFGVDDDGEVQIFQYQPDADGGKRPLSADTFFWYAHHASVTNPNGVAVFSAAVAETVKEMHFEQDVTDAVHNAAWQRYVYKYSREAFWRIAVTPADLGGLGLPVADVETVDGVEVPTTPAADWVDGQLAEIKEYLSSLAPDDNMVADSSGGVDTLGAMSFVGLEGVLQHEDYRLIRALDELPTTMGAPKAGAQTFTTVEWANQAGKQEALRAAVMAPILDLCNAHFRLQGRRITVKAEYEPIRRSDAVADANAAMVTHNLRKSQWMLGLITFEEFALSDTGSGPPKNDPDAYTGPDPEQDHNTVTEAEPAPLPAGGTTQEDQNASNGK